MSVCEDKEQNEAPLHFYTINTFCLEQEITCTLILLRWYFDTFTDTIFLSSWWRGISERDGSVYIPARKLKYLHAYLNVLKKRQPCTFKLGVVCQWAAPKPVLRRQVKGGSTMVYRQMAPPSLFSVPLCECVGTQAKMCTTQWCAVNELNTTQIA